jgi:hypothetical protein
MARFPKKEAEIAALAEQLYRGLLDNNPTFPQPPVHPMLLRMKKLTYQSRHNNFMAARAAAEQSIADKDTALEELINALKSDIRYAENTVNFDDDKLKLIGWSGKDTPTALAPPGETRQLEAPKQGDGWVFLDWKAPADGGKVSAYKIQRRNRPEGTWQEVGTAIETESTLVDQPKGAELEYRIIAINKSGEGSPSNTVMMVL